MKSEQLAMQYWYWAMGAGLTALILPWIVVWFNRRWATGVAVILALTSTLLEYFSNKNMPNNIDIRVDIVFLLPVLILAWLQSIAFALFAILRKSPKTP